MLTIALRLFIALSATAITSGCAGPSDMQRAESDIENGYQQSGISQLMFLADKGYSEASLALGNFYLMEKNEGELLNAQRWYSPLLPYSDEARLGYSRWLAKVSHIDPSIRPITKHVLMYRQRTSGDVSVELSRFIVDYSPADTHLINAMLIDMQENPDVDRKDVLRVIDALPDPVGYQKLLSELCASPSVDFHFYCIRAHLRLVKLYNISDYDTWIATSHAAFENEQITVRQLVSIAELLASDDVGLAQPALAKQVTEPWLETNEAVLLGVAKLALQYPAMSDPEVILPKLETLHDRANPTASLLLGKFYLDGVWVAERPNIAAQYFEAALSEAEAKYRLGILILSGKLVGDQAQKSAQYGVDLLVSAGRDYYLNAYEYLARLFSDADSYLFNPVYAHIFAAVHERLGGTLSEEDQQQVFSHTLGINESDTVAAMTDSELADGVKGWRKITVRSEDIAFLLGEKS
ncbi:hypothetical protein [Alteromonas oceanisediminis]|uniref:hypothetical protein n=1 Tax=Alteromonas oceanisediminis TaxID=2836180 RepID=UPI001BD951F6|nr:hypothetical protein [Alteromonas oceanisediminis]MBT0585624.1 hypothetical protein [Alteromonas oceanisediminis]